MGTRTFSAAATRVNEIIRILDRTYPDARLELNFSSPLELLVALILAAQCTDKKVNEVTPVLFSRYRCAADYVAAQPEELEELIRQTGFFRQKTRTIQSCCRQLVERFGGKVPANRDDLLSLPGVGRKTANILLGNAFGVPGIGVDTHVARLSQRLGLTAHKEPDKIEADLTRIVFEKDQIRFCHLLQSHGRRVCFARKPDCPACSVAALCPYPAKTPPLKKVPGKGKSRWIRQPLS